MQFSHLEAPADTCELHTGHTNVGASVESASFSYGGLCESNIRARYPRHGTQ